jgi:hypothetical protein
VFCLGLSLALSCGSVALVAPAILLALTLLVADPAASGPLVLWPEGGITLAEPATAPLAVAERLVPGQEMVLAPGASIEVFVEPDLWMMAIGPGRVVARADGLEAIGVPPPLVAVEPLHGVRLAQRPSGLSIQLGAQTPAPGFLIRAPRATRLTSPAKGIDWWEARDQTRFELELTERDPERGWKPLERWHGLAGSRHELWTPLGRSRLYRVQVTTRPAWPETPLPHGDSTLVEVLSIEEAASVVQDLATLRRWEVRLSPGTPSFAVLQALLLEAWGLWEDAEATWGGLGEHHSVAPGIAERVERVRSRTAMEAR